MARLDEICRLNMGQSPDSSSYNEIGEGIPFFQGNADFGEVFPTVRVWCNAPTKIAYPGDILISVRAPIGALNIADVKCCIGRGLAALTVDESICSKQYLWYAIANKVEELNSKGTGSTFKAISKSILSETEIPLPPLDEQRRIVSILDKVTSLIALRKQQLTKLDELVKARFVEMFGDLLCEDANHRKVPLESLAKIGSSKRIFENEYVFSGIPFYRTKEIVELSKGDSVSTELYISNERFSEIRRKYGAPQKGDLLISAVGTIGVIWIVDQSQDFYYKDGNLLQVSPGTTLDSVFLKYILEELISFYKSKMSTGTAYNALTISELRKMMIPVVDYSKQKNFASFTKKVIEIKLTIRQNLDILEILKNSLLQKCFKRGSYNA